MHHKMIARAVVLVAVIAPVAGQSVQPYCAATSRNVCCSNTGTLKEYIGSVSIADMTVATPLGFDCPGGYNGYLDRTDRIANLSLGATYTLTVVATVPNVSLCATFAPQCRAWFDWNGDGTFATGLGSTEEYDLVRSGTTYRGRIVVPSSAVGYLRLRVGSAWPGFPPPCGVLNDPASFRDFSILVAGGAPIGLRAFGAGVGGAAGVPSIAADSPPYRGNSGFGIEVRGVAPSTNAFVLVGVGSASLPLFGGTLYVDPNQPTVGLSSSATASGVARVSAPIPRDVGLIGLQLYAQGFALDGSAPQGWAATGGLEITVRP